MAVPASELAQITTLSVSLGDTSPDLKAGDFAGLTEITGLQTLILTGPGLTVLPADVFRNDLTDLDELRITTATALTSLPVGVFDRLDSLRTLQIRGANLNRGDGLPSGIFDGILDTVAFENFDDNAINAHFVCSRDDAFTIATNAGHGGTNRCLLVSSGDFALYGGELNLAFTPATVANMTYVQGVAVMDTLPVVPVPDNLTNAVSVTYSIAPALPEGLAFNSDTAELTGTPTSLSGIQEHTLTATIEPENVAEPFSLSFNIEVEADTNPVFSFAEDGFPPIFIQDVDIGNVAFTATGGNGNLTYGIAAALPPGLALNSNTGVLTGIPTTVGNVVATLTVQDADGDRAFENGVVIRVESNTAPAFPDGPLPNLTFVQGSDIGSLRILSATGGNGNLIYSLAPTPAGLTLNPDTGVLTGTPTELETTSLTLTVMDSDTNTAATDTDSADFTVTVEVNAIPSFGILGPSTFTFVQNVAIDSIAFPAATGGNGDLTYTLPNLPAGLMLSADVVLTGTPTELGTTFLTLTVMDSDTNIAVADTASQTLTITVEADTAPSFGVQTVDTQVYTASEEIMLLVLPEATGGNGDLTYTLTGLHTGLAFNPDTRELTGTPTEIANRPVELSVADSDGNTETTDTDSLEFVIDVVQNTEPSLAGLGNLTFGAGDDIIHTFTVTGGNGDINLRD